MAFGEFTDAVVHTLEDMWKRDIGVMGRNNPLKLDKNRCMILLAKDLKSGPNPNMPSKICDLLFFRLQTPSVENIREVLTTLFDSVFEHAEAGLENNPLRNARIQAVTAWGNGNLHPAPAPALSRLKRLRELTSLRGDIVHGRGLERILFAAARVAFNDFRELAISFRRLCGGALQYVPGPGVAAVIHPQIGTFANGAGAAVVEEGHVAPIGPFPPVAIDANRVIVNAL